MKKKIALLTLLFVVFLISLTPSKLIGNFIPNNAGVELNDIRGTIWSGEVGQANVQVNRQKMTLENILYSLNWLDVFRFRPSIAIDIERGPVNGQLDYFLSADANQSLKINKANLKIDSQLFESFLPLKELSLEGSISTRQLDAELIRLQPKMINGEISWNDAAVLFAGQRFMLGNFKANVVTVNNQIIAEILKANNKLSLEGTVTLDKGTVTIEGSIATDIDPNIYNALVLFNSGKPENGRLPIKFRQKLF